MRISYINKTLTISFGKQAEKTPLPNLAATAGVLGIFDKINLNRQYFAEVSQYAEALRLQLLNAGYKEPPANRDVAAYVRNEIVSSHIFDEKDGTKTYQLIINSRSRSNMSPDTDKAARLFVCFTGNASMKEIECVSQVGGIKKTKISPWDRRDDDFMQHLLQWIMEHAGADIKENLNPGYIAKRTLSESEQEALLQRDIEKILDPTVTIEELERIGRGAPAPGND